MLCVCYDVDTVEDERTHMSGLLQELVAKDIITSSQVLQVCMYVCMYVCKRAW